MKTVERFSAFETSVGKYSAHKVPQWRMGCHELLEYLELMNTETEDLAYTIYSA